MTAGATDEGYDLGIHLGMPILAQKIIINKTGDGLSKAMPFDPFEIDADSEHFLNLHVRHRKTRFDNVYSKDDPDKLIGFNRVDILEARGVTRWSDDVAAGAVREMERKIKDEEDRIKAEKRGQFRMPEGEVVEAEGRDATIHSLPGAIAVDDPDDMSIAPEGTDEDVAQFEADHPEFLEPVTDESIDAILEAAAKDDEDR